MVLHRKPLRRQLRQIARAGVDIEHPLAQPTLKVVVVLVARQLEAEVLPGQLDLAELAVEDGKRMSTLDV